jgi:hypothetical protein
MGPKLIDAVRAGHAARAIDPTRSVDAVRAVDSTRAGDATRAVNAIGAADAARPLDAGVASAGRLIAASRALAAAARARGHGIAVADAGPSPLARRALVNWCRRQTKAGDLPALGRRLPEEPAPLSRARQLELIATLRGTYPTDHGLPGYLWSRQSLGELIHQRHSIRLTMRAVNRLLTGWGLAPRTPADRACPQCVASVVSWLSREYPGIARRARAGGAQMCWAGRTRPVGLFPEVTAAVTTRGGLRFAVSGGRAEAPLPVSFLSRLVAHEARAVHVILDGSIAAADWPRRPPAGVALHSMPCCARSRGD